MASPFDGPQVGSYEIVRFLIAEDLVPPECTVINIDFPIDGSVQILYRVNLTEGRLQAFMRAFNAYLASQLNWADALEHFNEVKSRYLQLQGQEGVNVAPALVLVFAPLEERYQRGERTAALHAEMMKVE